MPALWVLSRFEHDRQGNRFAGKTARSLGAALEAGGAEVVHADPLDAWVTAGKGLREVHLESGAFETPSAAIFWTEPFRPDADPSFCGFLEAAGATCRNGAKALAAFADRLEPFVRLSGAGLRIEKAARARRPHCTDDLIATIGMPLDLVLPLRGGEFEKMRISDRGSLRGMLDHMWRSDIGAVAVKALVEGETEEWVPVAGGRAFGTRREEALAAAEALSMDFGCFLVRGEGGRARIADSRLFPAPPGEDPSVEILEAVAGSLGEPGRAG